MKIEPIAYQEYVVDDIDRNITHSVGVCDTCFALVPDRYFDQHEIWHQTFLATSEESVATTN